MIKRCFAILMIMTFLFLTMNVSAFTITYDGITEEYTGRTVTLYVNDEKIEFDMPAIILNSRSLVPARAVFEALGASVTWDESEQKVEVREGEISVVMTVNSAQAYVNGYEKQLDCPAMIINNRLMIPVRFPSEAIGCNVLWEDKTSSVRISRKTGEGVISEKSAVTIMVELESSSGMVEDFAIDGDTPRVVVDLINNSVISISPENGFVDTYVKTVRTGHYTDTVTRVVVDLEKTCDYSVIRHGKTVYILISGDNGLPEEPDINEPEENGVKLVVIDAGHGGSDVGAIGKENGVDVLYEKDVNLSVSLYLDEYLKNNGVETFMIRNSDSTVSLYDRPQIANSLDASLYVSVHSNSFTASSANGTTVLYYKAEGEESQSNKLAQLIQDELVDALGTYDRGLMDGSEMHVIKKTTMPAVIVEMAFISNPDDRKILSDDECRKKAAHAIGRAVIKMLESVN